MNNFLITVAVKLLMITGGDDHNKNMEMHEPDNSKISVKEFTIPDTINELTDSLEIPMIEIE